MAQKKNDDHDDVQDDDHDDDHVDDHDDVQVKRREKAREHERRQVSTSQNPFWKILAVFSSLFLQDFLNSFENGNLIFITGKLWLSLQTESLVWNIR